MAIGAPPFCQALDTTERVVRLQWMIIKIKRAYEAPSAQDGTRVLVDRLWPRGLRKSAAVVYAAHDEQHNHAIVLREVLLRGAGRARGKARSPV